MLFAVLVVFAGCEPETEPPPEDPAIQPDEIEARTVVDVLQQDDRFSEFVAALEDADLVQTLHGPGPFTVFAPTNDAFDALPEDLAVDVDEEEQQDRLIEILIYHIVSGMNTSEDLAQMESITTLHGGELTIIAENGDIMLNEEASVIEADIEADNGIVHAIDAVLTTPEDEMTDPASQ